MNAPFVLAQATTTPSSGAPAPTTVRVSRPADRSAVVLRVEPGSKIDLQGIANEQIVMVRSGDRLIVLFQDQSAVVLERVFDGQGRPVDGVSFELAEGRSVSGQQFATTFPISTDPSILPAAGPASAAGTTNGSAKNTPDPTFDAAAPRNPLDLLGDEEFGSTLTDILRTPDTFDPNDDPLFGAGADAGGVTELTDADPLENAVDLVATGVVPFSDADLGDSHTLATSFVSVAGAPAALGTFVAVISDSATGDGAGAVTWTFTVPDSAVDYLAVGETITQVYELTITDAAGATDTQLVTVTITGTNDAPVITAADATGAVTEDASAPTLTDTGTITFDDVDLTDGHSVSAVTPGLANTLGGTLAAVVTGTATGAGDGTVTWTYTVDNAVTQSLAEGETLTETFTVTISDGNGGTVDQLITITINGTNDAPVIEAASVITGSVTETGLAEDDVTPVTGPLTATGTMVSSDDDKGATDTETVTITINGTNDAPVIGAGTTSGSVTEIADGALGETTADLTATGSLAFTDVDLTNSHTVSPTLLSVTGAPAELGSFTAIITDAATGDGAGTMGWTFTVNDGAIDYLAAGQTITQVYRITVTDSSGATATQDVTITINGSNDAPVITSVSNLTVSEEGLPGAIPDTTGNTDTTDSVVASGSVVASDVDGDTLTYSFGTPTTPLTSGGTAIVWTPVGNDLVGTAGVGGPPIITLSMDPVTGSYSATLNGPVDHAPGGGENTFVLTIPVNVNDGTTTTTTPITLTIEDDSGVAVVPQAAVLNNGAGAPVSFNLDSDVTLANNYGADGGTVRFASSLNGATSTLTSGGQPIVYSISPDGLTLSGNVGATNIFTVTLNPATAQYTVDMNGTVDSVTTVDFNSSAYAFSGGNSAWNGFVATGESLGSVVIDNNSADLLLTPGIVSGGVVTYDGTINTTANSGGVSNTFVGANEVFRVDFVTDLRGNPAGGGGYSNAGNRDHVFDGHYLTNGASATFTSTSGTTIKITAFDDTNGNNVVGDGTKDTINKIAIRFGAQSLLIDLTQPLAPSYLVGGQTYTVVANADGSVTVGGVIETGGNATQIAVYTETQYNSLEYQYVSGSTFQIGGFGASVPSTAPVGFTLPVEVVDNDGDVAASAISIALVQPGQTITTLASGITNQSVTVGAPHIIGNDLDNQLTGDSASNVLSGGAGNDTLIGGGGVDFLFGGDGDDLLIGGAGADHLTGGAGSDRFRFLSSSEGTDVIKDFVSGTDFIELAASGFATLTAGQDLSGLFGASSSATFNYGAGEKLHFDTSSSTLYFDSDGSGGSAPVALAKLENGAVLNASDLRVV